MRILVDIFSNYALLSAAAAWILAQLIKIIIDLVTMKRINFRLLMSSGGMPSSHSATVCALATSAGYIRGFRSLEFAMSFIFAFIVMYDASGVRRAAGEQAKILNRLVRELEEGKKINMQKQLKELIGHTPLEVMAGALMGIMIGIIFHIVFTL